MKAPLDPFARLDVWETIKGFVMDRAPRLSEAATAAREERWRTATRREGQLLAVLVALDLETENPALRRRARTLLKSLLAELDPNPNGVREDPADEPLTISDRLRARLLATLRWLEDAGDPATFLNPLPGPQAAAELLRRKAPALEGLRAFRWLAALGYPSAVPDAPRQRVLERLGWLPAGDNGKSPDRATLLSAMEDLAHAAQAPLAEVNLVLGAFSGAGGEATQEAALCVLRPRCGQCPVREKCLYFRLLGRRAAATERPSQSLTEAVREEDRPREKMEALGPSSLGEDELVAILLRTGTGQANALDLARQLLRNAESLERLAAMSVAELTRLPGLGRVKALTLKAAFELAKRLRAEPGKEAGGSLRGAAGVHERLAPRFVGAKQEEFLALLLNTKSEIQRTVAITRGTLNQSLVHPREAFADAIRDAAYAVIFVHNHPSGDPAPSRDDRAITKRLVEVGDLVGVKVLDHVIIGGNGRYYSFADEGTLRD